MDEYDAFLESEFDRHVKMLEVMGRLVVDRAKLLGRVNGKPSACALVSETWENMGRVLTRLNFRLGQDKADLRKEFADEMRAMFGEDWIDPLEGEAWKQ